MLGLVSAVLTLRERPMWPVTSPASVTEGENGPQVGFCSTFQWEGLRVVPRPRSKIEWNATAIHSTGLVPGRGLFLWTHLVTFQMKTVEGVEVTEGEEAVHTARALGACRELLPQAPTSEYHFFSHKVER